MANESPFEINKNKKLLFYYCFKQHKTHLLSKYKQYYIKLNKLEDKQKEIIIITKFVDTETT